MKQTLAEALGTLVGPALSSVKFIADYVQLWFDGPCLTAYTPLVVTTELEGISLGQSGYRDILCAQIGCRVERTEVNKQHVSIIFESGAVASISLRDDHYRGPEALEFWLDKKDRIWVV
jgi:hypothetical protein